MEAMMIEVAKSAVRKMIEDNAADAFINSDDELQLETVLAYCNDVIKAQQAIGTMYLTNDDVRSATQAAVLSTLRADHC